MAVIISSTRSNVNMSGMASWKVRPNGETEFMSLGPVRNGKAVEKTLFTKDSKGREIPYAVQLEFEAEMLYTGSLVNIVELLDDLGSLDLDQQITMNNGITWDSYLLTQKFFGFEWELVSDKDRDDARFIKIKADRIIKIGELDTVHGVVTAGSTDADSVLLALKSLTRGDVVPAGINSIEFSADGSFENNFGTIRNGKVTCKLLTTKDSMGRSTGYGIEIVIDAEALQASATEIGVLDTLAGTDWNYKITLADGRIMSLTAVLGMAWEHHLDKDSDDVSFIKITASGRILFSAWNGIWT